MPLWSSTPLSGGLRDQAPKKSPGGGGIMQWWGHENYAEKVRKHAEICGNMQPKNAIWLKINQAAGWILGLQSVQCTCNT